MIALEVPIIFHPEVQWTPNLRPAGHGRRHSGSCLLPWICLALLDTTRSRRRVRKRRF